MDRMWFGDSNNFVIKAGMEPTRTELPLTKKVMNLLILHSIFTSIKVPIMNPASRELWGHDREGEGEDFRRTENPIFKAILIFLSIVFQTDI